MKKKEKMDKVDMVRDRIEQQMSGMPPAMREKLDRLCVSIVRSPGKIEVTLASNDVDAPFQEGFLDSLLTPLSAVANILGCRVEVDVRTG